MYLTRLSGYAHNLTEKREPLVLYLESRDLLNRIDSAHGERVKIEAGASETVAPRLN